MENPILNAVSVRGTIENSRSQGFSITDSFSEKIDNSKKAGCDQFVTYLDKETLQVTLVDNGSGQTKPGLANSYILNNRTKASKLNQSKFGQGGKMLEIELSDCKSSSIALSKKSGEKLHQVDANWAEAIAADRFDILAHGAEKEQADFWEQYAINQDQGTMYRIQCTEETFAQFARIVEDGSLVIKLALTYPAIHEGSLQIMFKYMNGDATIIVPPLDLLNEGTDSDMMQTDELGLYYDCEDKRNKVYFTEKNASVRLDLSEKTSKLIKEVPPATLKHIGNFCLQTKVAPEWQANKGGIYFERQDKIIDHYSPEYKKCGDFEWQRLRGSCRSKLHFDSDLDDTMQIEVNKSRINSRNIDPSILKTVEYLVEKYCKDIYKNDPIVIKKKKDAADHNRLKKKQKKLGEKPADVVAGADAGADAGAVPIGSSAGTGDVPTLKFKGNTLFKSNLLDWVRAHRLDNDALNKLEALLL